MMLTLKLNTPVIGLHGTGLKKFITPEIYPGAHQIQRQLWLEVCVVRPHTMAHWIGRFSLN